MVKLQKLSEASLLHNLRVRYEREVIYTSVGPILISVNPLRRLEWLQAPETAQRTAAGYGGAMPSMAEGSAELASL